MKKLRLVIISITFMAVSCHKKEISLHRLTSYLEKAQDKTLPLEQRLSFNKKALELVLQSDDNDSLFFNWLFKIADTYYDSTELEAYKKTSEVIVTQAKQVQDTLHLAKGYEYMGGYYRNNHINDSAYSYYLKAEKYYSLAQDKCNIGKMLLSRASILYCDGNLPQAEIFCLQALKIFNTLKNKDQNKRRVYDAYNLLGVVANDQQEYNKAIEYHNKAVQIITKDTNIVNKELLKVNSLNNIGTVYRNKNENKEALSYFAQALKTKELSQNAPHLYAMLLDNTAYSRFKLKDDTEVEDLFYKALRIRETLNIASGIVMSKVHMSEYYHLQKDIKKAFAFADEAYKTAKIKGTDPRNVMLTLRQLQTVNAPLKEAYAIEYNRIADSLQQAQPKIHETITQELAQAKAKEEAKIKKEEKYKILFIGLGGIICFVGVYYIMHHRNKKREEKIAEIQSELQANDRENRACIQEKETEVQEKESQIKIYDLLLHQDSKTKKKRGLERSNVVASLHETIFNRIWSLRLALGTFRTKESQKYVHDLKSLEEDVKKLYDFSTAIIQEEEQTKHDHYVSLLQKLFKTQRKDTALSDYMEVDWSYFDNDFKIHFYKMLDDFFTVIRQNKKQNKKTSLVELELYDQEEERGVIVLHIIFNEKIAYQAFQERSTNLKKIGGLLKIDHEQDNTKIEVVLSVKTHKIASLA